MCLDEKNKCIQKTTKSGSCGLTCFFKIVQTTLEIGIEELKRRREEDAQ